MYMMRCGGNGVGISTVCVCVVNPATLHRRSIYDMMTICFGSTRTDEGGVGIVQHHTANTALRRVDIFRANDKSVDLLYYTTTRFSPIYIHLCMCVL